MCCCTFENCGILGFGTVYVVGYKCGTISEVSADSFFKVEDKFLSQETTSVSIQLDACPLLILEAILI